jgi:transcriptional regulator with XRE-family HTH domain
VSILRGAPAAGARIAPAVLQACNVVQLSGPMTNMALPFGSRVLDGFLALGHEYRREYDLDELFDKGVRNCLSEALVRQYWGPIHQFLVRNHISAKDAGAAAGVNRSTYTRWMKSETHPSFPTICQIFAWAGLDMKGVPFPGGREALWQAFFRALEEIRQRLPTRSRGQKDVPLLDAEQWECLRMGVCSEAVLEGLRAGVAGRERLRAATDGLASDLARRFPGGQLRDGAVVRRVFDDWLIPWVLFYTVVPYDEKGVEQ